MSSSPDNSSASPALIFIPDISGFTQFVTDTEMSHSKHIIEELLETIIDANKIGLEISEIEGDAILFYRFGNAPSPQELMDQVRQMFNRFHLHLKKYESHRICNCGACRTANNLTIKFIAHYGDITINTIRQYKKLFGKDVIVAHRLLKNDIGKNEYLLVTDNLTQENKSWDIAQNLAWSNLESGQQEYDSGKVQFTYLSLDPLMKDLPEISPEDYGLDPKSMVLENGIKVNAPMDLVFDVLSDVYWRSKWIPGTTDVTNVNSAITQVGQSHRCIANGPIIIGHDYKRENKMIRFTETDSKKTYCVVYTLTALDDQTTEVRGKMFIGKNALKEMMFKIMMKKKLLKTFDQAWLNFKDFCEDLYKRGERHSYSIKFEEEMSQAVA
jgi:hypothetical protein